MSSSNAEDATNTTSPSPSTTTHSNNEATEAVDIGDLYYLVIKANHHKNMHKGLISSNISWASDLYDPQTRGLVELYESAVEQIRKVVSQHQHLLLKWISLDKTIWDKDARMKHHVSKTNGYGLYPIEWAILLNNIDLCRIFLSHNDKPIQTASELLIFAIHLGRVEITKALIDVFGWEHALMRVYPRIGKSPFQWASYYRDTKILKVLIKAGCWKRLFQRMFWKDGYFVDMFQHSDGKEDENEFDSEYESEEDIPSLGTIPPWEQNRPSLWHLMIHDFENPSPSTVYSNDRMDPSITSLQGYLSTIFEGTYDSSLLTEAIGKIPQSHIFTIMEATTIDYWSSKRKSDIERKLNMLKPSPLVETIKQYYHHQGHWKDYYSNLFFQICYRTFPEVSPKHLVMNGLMPPLQQGEKEGKEGDFHFDSHLPVLPVMTPEQHEDIITSFLQKNYDEFAVYKKSDLVDPWSGRNLLHFALDHELPWEGINWLLMMNLHSLTLSDVKTGLYPFMTAAEKGKFSTRRGLLPFVTKERSLNCLSTTYNLLRAMPNVLGPLLNRRSFLRNKVKYRGYGRITANPASHESIPAVVTRQLEMLRLLPLKEREKVSITTDPSIVQALRMHHEAGKFHPNFNYGSAFSILCELGETPVSTDVMVQDVNANCWEENYGANYSVEDRCNTHVPLDMFRQHYRQEVRLLRYHELHDHIMQQQDIYIGNCFFFDAENSVLGNWTKTGIVIEMPDLTVMRQDTLTPDEIRNFVMFFLMEYAPYCNNGTMPKMLPDGCQVLSWKDMENQCKFIHSSYKETKAPLGNPDIYIPPSLRSEGPGADTNIGTKKSKSKNSKKKGKKSNQKKKKHTHATIMSHLISTLFQQLEDTITSTRPACQYAQFIYVLTSMLFDASNFDIDVAIAICGEANAGNSILSLRNKILKYAKDFDAVTLLPPIFSQLWWGAFERCSFIIVHAMRMLFSNKLNLKLSIKALDFFRARMYPELITNILSDSKCEKFVGWRCINMVLDLVPMTFISTVLGNDDIFRPIRPLCTEDFEATLNRTTFVSKHEKKMTQKNHQRASQESLHFISMLCGRVRKGGNPGTSQYKEMVKRIMQLDIIQLCVVCAKQQNVEYIFTYSAMESLVTLATIHKKCKVAIWELKDEWFELARTMMASDNCVHAHIAMALVQELLSFDDIRDRVMSMQPPIESLCMRLITFGLNFFVNRAYMAQSHYLANKDKLVKGAHKYNDIQKQKTKTVAETKWLINFNELRKKLTVLPHWCNLERPYNEGEIENTMATPLLLICTLTQDISAQSRFRHTSCLSFAAACLESNNRKLFTTSVSLLTNFFRCGNLNFPEPSDFQDHLYLVQMLMYFASTPQQLALMELPFIIEMVRDILIQMKRTPQWSKVLCMNITSGKIPTIPE